jgi:hypothetical protein
MATSKAVHQVEAGHRHWASEEEGCPKCKTMKGYPCIDTSDTSRQYLPDNTVHVARVRANGHGVKG